MTSRPQRILGAVTGVLQRGLVGFVLLATAAGLVAPGVGRALDAGHAVLVVLSVLVLTAGLGVDGAGLRRLREVWRPVAITLAVSTVALPAAAWLAARLVTDPALRGGVLAAGVAPAEVAAVALSALAGSDTAVAAAVLIGSTLTTVLLAGPLLTLLAATTISVDPAGLLGTLALVVALPLAVGIVARTRRPAAPWTGANPIGTLALLVLVYLVAAQIPHTLGYLPVVPALLAFLTAAAVLGALLARMLPSAQRPAVLLPVAMRDFAVAAGIADTAFGHLAVAPLGLYGVLVLLFGTLTARRTTPAR